MTIEKIHPKRLRCVICGSAGDGKSTLVGQLTRGAYGYHEKKNRSSDPSPSPQRPNSSLSSTLMLPAEWSARRSDDAAYRPVANNKRTIDILELPDSAQGIVKLAGAASLADVIIIVIDVRNGPSPCNRQHSHIASMLGIRNMVVAMNKMDLAGWDRAMYESVTESYRDFANRVGIGPVHCLPVSALDGSNIAHSTSCSPWYTGGSLLELLENISVDESLQSPFRMLVEGVCEVGNRQGFLCQSMSGKAQVGDHIRITPAGAESRIESMLPLDETCDAHDPRQRIVLTCSDSVKADRGDVITPYDHPVESADQFQCSVLWTHLHDFMPGRWYKAAINNREVRATATAIKHKTDIDSGAHLAAKSVSAGDIAVVNLTFDLPVPFEPYASSRGLGAFRLIDLATAETTGIGTIQFPLRRASNIHWQALDVSREARAALKGQRARCFWFTGLSGSGKSTIANLLDKRLHASGRHTFVLDGDNVRHGLNRDLGFTEADRAENIRRIAEVARLMADAGLIVLVSFISPYRAERAFARSLFRSDEFVEVYVDTPLAVCESRDTKGLYAKARAGKLPNFTGLDSPYEAPESPEFIIKTTEYSAPDAAERLARLVFQDANPHARHHGTPRTALVGGSPLAA